MLLLAALALPTAAFAQDRPRTWAFADETHVVHPTAVGVFSIYAGDGESCSHGCMGTWRGPNCSPLTGIVVSIYEKGLSPRQRRQVGPLAQVATNADGWADFARFAKGTYFWTVAFPAGTEEGTVEIADASPPIDPCTGCIRMSDYDDDPAGRPDESWFSVVVDLHLPR